MSAAHPFDHMFQALADPCRRSFVERLARGPATVKELAEPAQVQLPAVLKHLRVLEKGGLVASEKVGRVRTYCICPDAFDPMSSWIEQRKVEMNVAFDRLATLMVETPEEKDH